jgi:hypothetical protein
MPKLLESTKTIIQSHLPVCPFVPESIHLKLDKLKDSPSWSGSIMQFCNESFKALSIEETTSGLRFTRPSSHHSEKETTSSPSAERRILFPEDKELVEPYLYFLLEQVEVCYYSDVDTAVARSKGKPGFAGMQCRHCNGHGGNGKYFPASPEALVVNSMTQNLYAHLMKCKFCPQEVRSELNYWKGQKSHKDHIKTPGWRKEFFVKLWKRLHGN